MLFLGDGSTKDKRTVRLGRTSINGNETGDNVYGSAFPRNDSGTYSPRSDGKAGALDLDKPIHYGDQTDWKMTEIGTHCLAVGKDSTEGNTTEWLTYLRLPTALTGFGNEVVKHNSGNGTQLKEVIFEAPSYYGGLAGYIFYGHNNITNFVLKVPHATSLGHCFLYSACDQGLSATDVSKWDLSSVTYLGNRALAHLKDARGTLRLPKLNSTANQNNYYGVFQGSGFDGIEIGESAGSKITIGSYAFSACPNLQRVTISGSVDVDIGTNAFSNCGALKKIQIGTVNSPNVCLKSYAFYVCTNIEEVVLGGRDQLYFEYTPFCFSKMDSNEQKAVPAKLNRMRFLGVAPTCGPLINNVTTYWGNYSLYGHIPAKQITFEIPQNNQSWTTFFAKTTLDTPSESETSAYHTTWKTRAIPYGVIPANFQQGENGSLLGLKNVQYLAIGDRVSLPALDCVGDSRYGDQIVVSYDSDGYKNDVDGTIPYGAPLDKITVTASTTCENGSFVRWYYGGAITEENQRTNPLVLTFEEAAKNVYGAAFQHNWTYDADKEQISDGVWALWVSPIDTSARKLIIGLPKDKRPDGWSQSYARGHGYTGTGSGRLDLSGVVKDKDSQSWTITQIDGYAFGNGTQELSVKTSYVTEIVFPESIEKFGEQIFNHGYGSPILQTVVLEAPELTILGGWTFSFQCVRRMVLRIPKVMELTETFLGSNHTAEKTTVAGGMQNPLDLTDAGEWDLSGVTTCSGRRTFSLNCLLHGTLRLPRCTKITGKATYAHGFLWNAQQLDGIELATDTNNLSIATEAFKNSQFKNLVIGARRTLSVDSDAFSGCTALTNLTYIGKAPDKANVDAILAGVTVPDDGSKNCTIRASAAKGWKAYADACTTDEQAKAPSDSNLQGVYVTEANARKAWLIHQPGKWEPMGALIMLW